MIIVRVFFKVQRLLNVSSELITLCGASAALIWICTNVGEVFQRVEWTVLIFFESLIVMVGGLEAAGIFEPVTDALLGLAHLKPRLLVVEIIWVVAILSALVDNVPVTIAMSTLLSGLAASGANICAVWWGVVFGVGFGGNATSIGSQLPSSLRSG